MAARLLGYFPPGSSDWHAARARGLGGSEIAAVLGLSPFESRFSLWHRKASRIGPVEETPEMEWGKRLEEAVLRKFLDTHAEFTNDGWWPGTYCHPERPWQIANPDFLRYHRRPDEGVDLVGAQEIKTSPKGEGWGPDGTDEVPPHVRCQALWYADVFGFETVGISVLISGCDYREYELVADPDECAYMREEGRRFLVSVDQGQRPDIDEHDATYQAIRELHPDIDGTEVVLENDLARLYIASRHVLAAAEDNHALRRSQVADAMGTAHRATWDGQTVATRQSKQGSKPFIVAARTLPAIGEPTPERTAA